MFYSFYYVFDFSVDIGSTIVQTSSKAHVIVIGT
jgi:hypothetical protein